MSTRYEWRQTPGRIRRRSAISRKSWTCFACLTTLRSGNPFAVKRHNEVCKARKS